MDTRCQACGLEGESINHVIFDCTVARQIWTLSDLPWHRVGFDSGSIYTNMILALRRTLIFLSTLEDWYLGFFGLFGKIGTIYSLKVERSVL